MNVIKSLFWKIIKIYFALFFKIFGKPHISKELRKTLSLYENCDFFELFSLIRVWDSPFMEINKNVPKSGLIYDLGCGDGTQTNYLALSSIKRKIIGIELNKERLDIADKGIKNVTFKNGDIIKQSYLKADCFILTHVLHHLPSRSHQITVLKKIKKSLKKNGCIVIVEISEKPLLKYIFTWLTDAFTVPILFEKKLYDFNFHYRRVDEWAELLSDLGFTYTITYPHKNKPFSHVTFKCKIRT